ncbi:Farnesoate epoxidase [Orchesella cincta]|uniref:Farnesoate epoxidase n=1 Tax=Orchesella cincta TaxID=48709 RepID=A0A1D2N6N3_ORCCI|nr:Farnesoate epoxidase [Orchesella cincta]
MLPLTLVAAAVIFLGILWWMKQDTKDGGFKAIPGPIGLPLFGNVLQVGNKMHLKFADWAVKYGDIYQIYLGNRRSIVISDPKMMKEIFTVEPAFSGRAFFEGFEMYPNEPLGIVSTEGELWEVHRRFLLRQLRDFGFGKSTMEQLILDEVKETIDLLKSSSAKPISNIKEIFQVSVINSLWTIVANERFNHDDPRLLSMMADSARLTDELMNRAVMFFVPWTRHFLPPLAGFEEVRDRNRRFYETAVDAHKATYQEGTTRDFIDVYLAEIEANKDNPASLFHDRRQAEKQLHAILADLFFAGTDTTSNTLAWAVLYLAKNQDAQKKMQKEISSVTGDSRLVTVSDRSNMPYTNGVMDETMRKSSIVASGVQHRAMAGKQFREYFIPTDTWIFPNLYFIHHNPKIWGDPANFRPERFLTPDEKTYKKNDNLLPFQVGRRQCVGESLARDSFFLFLTNIFQRFSISLDPNVPEPSNEPQVGFVLSPESYSIILKDRNTVK